MLTESKNEFRLILDTAAEGIFEIDTEGKCTFCNSRCIELLGYESENDLIGKDMHLILHGRPEDDPETPAAECPIRKAVLSGEKVHTEDGAFKRADGSSFCMELFAYPKYIDGKCVGAVITFLDISKRKLNEERLQYLNRHDSLTGLLNRQYFELAIEEYDKPGFAAVYNIRRFKRPEDDQRHLRPHRRRRAYQKGRQRFESDLPQK